MKAENGGAKAPAGGYLPAGHWEVGIEVADQVSYVASIRSDELDEQGRPLITIWYEGPDSRRCFIGTGRWSDPDAPEWGEIADYQEYEPIAKHHNEFSGETWEPEAIFEALQGEVEDFLQGLLDQKAKANKIIIRVRVDSDMAEACGCSRDYVASVDLHPRSFNREGEPLVKVWIGTERTDDALVGRGHWSNDDIDPGIHDWVAEPYRHIKSFVWEAVNKAIAEALERRYAAAELSAELDEKGITAKDATDRLKELAKVEEVRTAIDEILNAAGNPLFGPSLDDVMRWDQHDASVRSYAIDICDMTFYVRIDLNFVDRSPRRRRVVWLFVNLGSGMESLGAAIWCGIGFSHFPAVPQLVQDRIANSVMLNLRKLDKAQDEPDWQSAPDGVGTVELRRLATVHRQTTVRIGDVLRLVDSNRAKGAVEQGKIVEIRFYPRVGGSWIEIQDGDARASYRDYELELVCKKVIAPDDDGFDDHGYPRGWPKCPGCDKPALDGHITCGDVRCNEAKERQLIEDAVECGPSGIPIPPKREGDGC